MVYGVVYLMRDGARESALRSRIETDPWDAAAWDGLVSHVASKGTITQQREIYELVLEQYPTAVRQIATLLLHLPIASRVAARKFV